MDQDCSNWKTQRKCLKQSLSQESHSPLQGCTATGPNSILGDSNFWESWAMRKTPIGTARWVVTLPPPLCIPLTQYTLYRISNLLHTLQRAPTLQGVHIMTSIVNSATVCPTWNKVPPWKFPGDLKISRGPGFFQVLEIFRAPENFQVFVCYIPMENSRGGTGKCSSQSTTAPLKTWA